MMTAVACVDWPTDVAAAPRTAPTASAIAATRKPTTTRVEAKLDQLAVQCEPVNADMVDLPDLTLALRQHHARPKRCFRVVVRDDLWVVSLAAVEHQPVVGHAVSLRCGVQTGRRLALLLVRGITPVDG